MLEIGGEVKDDELNLKYDPYWLAVLRNTNHLLSVEKKNRFILLIFIVLPTGTYLPVRMFGKLTLVY